MKHRLLAGILLTVMIAGCTGSETKPVDIFAEDNCSQCRMAVSDERYASEIINDQGDVFKFDDPGCMLTFRSKHADLKIAAIFLKDYTTKAWVPYERATIVETNVETPMGSGRVAFADPEQAKAFQRQNPRRVTSAGADKCCE